MDKILALLIPFGVIFIGAFFLIKNQNTYNQHMKISNAIHRYNLYCIHNRICSEVDYEDEEDYDKTFLRIFDWGYENILPKEKLKIIKGYIIE